ncbi:MAG: hypothetical protein ACOY42_02175 [Pseudomonadota bacterium]
MTAPRPAKGMGRKPAHIGQYGTQDAIWRAVRELGTFTAAELICRLNRELPVNDETVKSYLKRLSLGGYLGVDHAPKHRGICRLATYRLVRDQGIETPRLRRDGTASEQGKAREQLWRAMKVLREFDWFELAIAARTPDTPVAYATAAEYAETLARAGYLAVVRPARGRIRARYRFIAGRNSGPRPPQVQRLKQVYDPNLDRVVWRHEAAAQGGDR